MPQLRGTSTTYWGPGGRGQLWVRGQAGQGFAFGIPAMLVVSALIVCVIVFVSSSAMMMLNQTKVMQAAESAARYGAQSSMWLGAPRPGYSVSQMKAEVTDVANGVLNQTGLPNAALVTVTAPPSPANSGVVTVHLTVAGIQLLGGGILPGVLNINAQGSAPYASRPMGVLGVKFYQLGEVPPVRQMYFPTYGAGNLTPGPSGYPYVSNIATNHFPYWETGTAASTPLIGPLQNQSGGGAFTTY